jgi:hypothetical protein
MLIVFYPHRRFPDVQLRTFSQIVRRLSICENIPTVIPGRAHQRVYARLRRATSASTRVFNALWGREYGIQEPDLNLSGFRVTG